MPNAKGGKKFKRGKKNTSFEKKLIYLKTRKTHQALKVSQIHQLETNVYCNQCFYLKI